jgi:hypothetical protein
MRAGIGQSALMVHVFGKPDDVCVGYPYLDRAQILRASLGATRLGVSARLGLVLGVAAIIQHFSAPLHAS